MRKCVICQKREQLKNSSRCSVCDKAYQAGRYSKKRSEAIKKPRVNGRPNKEEVEKLKQILGFKTDGELCGFMGGMSMTTLSRWKKKIPPHIESLLKLAATLYKYIPAKTAGKAVKEALSPAD